MKIAARPFPSYRQLVQTYPSQTRLILVILLTRYPLMPGDLWFFQHQGVGLNDLTLPTGKHPNAPLATPLILACEYRNTVAIRSLIACGASVNVPDYQGRSPMQALLWPNSVQGRATSLTRVVEGCELLIRAGGRYHFTPDWLDRVLEAYDEAPYIQFLILLSRES